MSLDNQHKQAIAEDLFLVADPPVHLLDPAQFLEEVIRRAQSAPRLQEVLQFLAKKCLVNHQRLHRQQVGIYSPIPSAVRKLLLLVAEETLFSDHQQQLRPHLADRSLGVAAALVDLAPSRRRHQLRGASVVDLARAGVDLWPRQVLAHHKPRSSKLRHQVGLEPSPFSVDPRPLELAPLLGEVPPLAVRRVSVDLAVPAQ